MYLITFPVLSCNVIQIHSLHRRYVPEYIPCSHVISFNFIHCTGDMYLSTSRALMYYPSCSYTAHPCSHFRFVQMDFKRVTTPVGWFDIWLYEPRYGPTTIDLPLLDGPQAESSHCCHLDHCTVWRRSWQVTSQTLSTRWAAGESHVWSC